MPAPGPLSRRSGAAAIEFALILPVIVLLVLGLAESVRRNLAMIDADAAAGTGAAAALRTGLDPARVAAAIAAHGPDLRLTSLVRLDCGAGRSAGACGALPPGRYARIEVAAPTPSLLSPLQPLPIRAIATVRLP